MSATIKVFNLGNKCFRHIMNSSMDSVQLCDENNDILLVYENGATVTQSFPIVSRMGKFHVEYIDGIPRWVFYEMPLQTRIVLGPDLLTSQVEVSKRYLGRRGLIGTK